MSKLEAYEKAKNDLAVLKNYIALNGTMPEMVGVREDYESSVALVLKYMARAFEEEPMTFLAAMLKNAEEHVERLRDEASAEFKRIMGD